MKNTKKLVLFDIDGTLIYHTDAFRFEDQYEMAMKEVYGVDDVFDLSKYNGTIDRYLAWDMMKRHGIPREEFLAKFPLYVEAQHRIVEARGKDHKLFVPISEGAKLVATLHTRPDIALGLITGNAERIAWWKINHTGYDGYFSFGLFGDEADDRISLAKLVFAKAKKVLHLSFLPADITVIGDTVFDIRCGKAIGAQTIGVTTGFHGANTVLTGEKPDLLVDSLMDPRVLSLFSL